jgi:hypothetical protein
MEENVKIEKIKKSCNVGKIVSNILCIICIVGCVCALIGGIWIFAQGREFDDMIAQGIESGIITTGDDIGSVRMVHIGVIDASTIHSDIPAMQEAINDHPYAISYGMTLMGITAFMAVAAVLIKLISSVFGLIIKEDTPFNDKVIKRVTIVLGAICAVMFLTSGMAFGVLGCVVTWVVYTILDYGKTLQIQSDETL